MEFLKHCEKEHPSRPVFPTISYIKKHRLKSQDPFWENLADMEGYRKLFTLKQ
ncbi:MAG: hypothetical protein ACM3ZS_04750 [Nitrososphaerota archaeon]|jgi:hypothetical protein